MVELEGITPAPCAAPHVAGLAALRSRVLTVIDGLAALDLGAARRGRAATPSSSPAKAIPMRLIVEEVEDVIEADGAARPARRAASAPAGTGSRSARSRSARPLFLLVDPYLLIAGPAANAA